MLATSVLSLSIATALQAAPAAWHEHYERGVALVEAGRGAEARAALAEALNLRSQEGLRVPTTGLRYVDYLPHLYLAAACHMAGDIAAAREQLTEARRSGMAAQSEAGARLLAAYQVLLREEVAPGATANPPAKASGYRIFERQPVLLSEPEFQRLRQAVLARCHLSTNAPRENTPWYFYYELGMELARRGDNQRALDALIESADHRPEPQRLARIYGMWFIDYFPYFEIARAHAKLGNRECARDALSLSERLSEVSGRDREMAELKALLKER